MDSLLSIPLIEVMEGEHFVPRPLLCGSIDVCPVRPKNLQTRFVSSSPSGCGRPIPFLFECAREWLGAI